jgi:hypothetical protein
MRQMINPLVVERKTTPEKKKFQFTPVVSYLLFFKTRQQNCVMNSNSFNYYMYYLKFLDLKSKQMTISLTTGIFNPKN